MPAGKSTAFQMIGQLTCGHLVTNASIKLIPIDWYICIRSGMTHSCCNRFQDGSNLSIGISALQFDTNQTMIFHLHARIYVINRGVHFRVADTQRNW